MKRILLSWIIAATFLSLRLLAATQGAEAASPRIFIEAFRVKFPLDDTKRHAQAAARSPGMAGLLPTLIALTNLNVRSTATFTVEPGAPSLSSGESEFTCVTTLAEDLDVILRALVANPQVEVFKRPRVQISGKSPVVVSTTYVSVPSGYNAAVHPEPPIEVTCSRSTNGMLLIHLKQTVDVVTGSVNIVNVGDVPVGSSRQSQACVEVRDGEIILIEGFSEAKERAAVSDAWFRDHGASGELLSRPAKFPKRKHIVGMLWLLRPVILPATETHERSK
jgi:hypothetical protein